MREDGTPMLADFGLSRVVMETSTGWTTSSSLGSYRWMAPELLAGPMKPVTVESDVWAFGCLCLEVRFEIYCFLQLHYLWELEFVRF